MSKETSDIHNIVEDLSSKMDRGTMTTKVGKSGATTLSRMNFSGFIGHVTILLECSLMHAI